MKLAIVIVTGKPNEPKYETPFYHGLFVNGDVATRWGFHNLRNLEWHWEEISIITDEHTAQIAIVGESHIQ